MPGAGVGDGAVVGLLAAGVVGCITPVVPLVPWLTCAVVGPEETARMTPSVTPSATGTASGAAARAVRRRLARRPAFALACPMPPMISG